jgi:hypothetical protein
MFVGTFLSQTASKMAVMKGRKNVNLKTETIWNKRNERKSGELEGTNKE